MKPKDKNIFLYRMAENNESNQKKYVFLHFEYNYQVVQLLFDYPWYGVLLCLLAGVAYAWWMYRKGVHLLLKGWQGVLAGLRFMTVALIALLLMAPVVKRKVGERQRPLVVVARDVSQSVKGLPHQVPDSWYASLGKHSSELDIVVDTFGGATTDIAAELNSIADRYAGRNLGAVVLASDGIYNQGLNPTSVTLPVPVYSIALGDTTHYRDAAIANVRYNHTAWLDAQFPIEVTIKSYRLKGSRATLTVSQGGRKLFAQPIDYTADDFSTTIPISLQADRAGVQCYTLTIAPCRGEHTSANNSCTIAVEVIDGHRKVAIVAAAPHPDVAALRQAIESDPNYEVEVMLPSTCNAAKVRDCSLLILHNIPSTVSGSAGLTFPPLPTIHILGAQTDLARFNAQHCGLEVIARSRKQDEVSAAFNRSFALFGFDESLAQILEQLPPLSAPFGEYRLMGGAHTLFSARIGTLATGRPLIAFCQQGGTRHAFVVGEGLWRWRLHEFQMTGNHAAFDELVGKMVTYTAMQGGHERFRITSPQLFRQDETVVVEAELYDDNFEPVNNVEAMLTLLPPATKGIAKAKSSQYSFVPSGTGYSLTLGTLAPGVYRYTATTTLAGQRFAASGSFAVEQLNLEQLNLVADHTLLGTLAKGSGGEMIYPADIDRLLPMIVQRDDLHTLIHSHTRYVSLLNLPLIFILLVLLLGAEWALRKWNYEI